MTDHHVGRAAVPLLKGIVYVETHPNAWETLLAIPGQVRDYLAALGLEVVIDESEGYAFVRQADTAAELDLPVLVPRRQLSYRVSLLLALLRGRLLELDAQGDQTRLVLTRDEIVEMVRVFHASSDNEARLASDVEADLSKIITLGFMRRVRDQAHTYEVRRVIKAFIDAQWLADFDRRLAEYARNAEADSTDSTEGDAELSDRETNPRGVSSE